jgi:hypothetical protein
VSVHSYSLRPRPAGSGTRLLPQLIHGFDDEGRQYDRSGALRPWWSASTSAAFNQSAQCLVRQYRAFNLTRVSESPEEYIRGFLTLGENLADQGGVTLSWIALQIKHAEEKDSAAFALAPTQSHAHAAAAPHLDRQLQRASTGSRLQLQPPIQFQQDWGHAYGSAPHVYTGHLGRSTRVAGRVSPTAADRDRSERSPQLRLRSSLHDFHLMQRVEPRLRELTEPQLFFLGYAQCQ